ncbi:hypothetical protein CO656_23920 [Sinorhizobium sp. FG01]|uniref:Transmembrane protein n=1 Tax=Sinorhizobium americanum TaxID=194963 RepID=A0A2S3YTW1_9HYPH|nr:hypothetical protein CO656_23920 [Sinorhizobium sp. FG01]POH35069.1 hypothetical protein ATY31_04795 [Sinorhizobium americanum]
MHTWQREAILRFYRIGVPGTPIAVAILTALCLWWLGPLIGNSSAQIASLYELQATLKRDAVITIFQGI